MYTDPKELLRILVMNFGNLHNCDISIVPECFDMRWSMKIEEIHRHPNRNKLAMSDSALMTCITLSVNWGYTPILTDIDSAKILKLLWPNGNSGHNFKDFGECFDILDSCLETYTDEWWNSL